MYSITLLQLRAHASDIVQTILSNLKLLFDDYVKNSKSLSYSLAKVPMFRIMIMLILVCIKSMLIGLIWEEIMMRVMIID
ncbi:hypothetical protein Goari_021534, partial [Gossypium aridum]|nr:hypothetical protein [Gossypium aridum]